MVRTVKALKQFSGVTHEDVYGALRVLIARRRELGVTQQDIANRMGVTVSVVSRLENSDSRNSRPPSLKLLQRYAIALGAEVRLAVT